MRDTLAGAISSHVGYLWEAFGEGKDNRVGSLWSGSLAT